MDLHLYVFVAKFVFIFVILGSLLDADTELAVRKSDVTTFRGAFESVMRQVRRQEGACQCYSAPPQHYSALVGRVAIQCVPCPGVTG